MRRLNLILVAGMLVTFLIHGIMGGLQLAGADADAQKWAAWILLCFIIAHTVVGTVLTVQSLAARRRAGAGYFRGNRLFWTRRISGFLILIPLLMHIFIFSASNADAYRLRAFTTGRMISQILLVAAVALHVLTNVRPALISFGVRGRRVFFADILFVLSVILLLTAAAFLIYWFRWAAY